MSVKTDELGAGQGLLWGKGEEGEKSYSLVKGPPWSTQRSDRVALLPHQGKDTELFISRPGGLFFAVLQGFRDRPA